MIRLNSTTIDWVDYDLDTKNLKICFTNGRQYTYFDVPEKTVTTMMFSGSIGRAFSMHVKPYYTCEKLGECECDGCEGCGCK